MDINCFEKNLQKYNKLIEELETLKMDLLDNAPMRGYTFDKNTNKFIKENDDIFACNYYLRRESHDESYGIFSVASGLIDFKDGLYDEIKNLFTENEEDYEELFENISSFYSYQEDFPLDDFYDVLKFSGKDYVDKENFSIIPLEYINTDREGCSKIVAELHFKDELYPSYNRIDGYISFFFINRKIYQKNKFKQKIKIDKYLRDNAPSEYIIP